MQAVGFKTWFIDQIHSGQFAVDSALPTRHEVMQRFEGGWHYLSLEHFAPIASLARSGVPQILLNRRHPTIYI